MISNRSKSAWAKVRKLFNDIHLWIGLGSGIIVILICFSGTVYVFNSEIREMASPELYKVERSGGVKPVVTEDLIAKVITETGGKVVAVKIPADPERAYQFMVRLNEKEKERHAGPRKVAKGGLSKKGKDTPPGGKRPTVFAVNQYTGTILGNISESRSATADFMKVMFSLHRWLLLDKIEEPLFGELENRKLGSYISGTATILFTLGVITGIVIWFPQRIRAWKQGLKIKWSGSWKRKNHDLHNSLGFYACLFLLLMGLTGPQWSFTWYRDGLKKMLGTDQRLDLKLPDEPGSVRQPGQVSMTRIADYLATADRVLGDKGDLTVNLPKDSTAAVGITKNDVGFFASPAGDKLLLDQYTAAVIRTEIFEDKPLNERISASIKALHIGDIYGLFSKIIYFFACLIATSLPVTGTIIWLNKLKKKNKTKVNKLKQPAL